ncbi:EAL domain-containing protein [Sporolactobacillus nakayamae]|uniref:EAL domain-containing protein n=1 Tax=Sporolactobacillus nakayamae TaxID=269670 RepID=UPI003CCBCC1C
MKRCFRWRHTELGVIPSGVFIEFDEQTGLINPIGEWVLKTVCAQLKKWLNNESSRNTC